jgi:hypothetical protein
MEDELTVDGRGPEHPDLAYLKSAIAIRKEGLLDTWCGQAFSNSRKAPQGEE